MMGTFEEYLGGASEFEDAYDAPVDRTEETFSSKLLEETLEVLGSATPVCEPLDRPIGKVMEGMSQRNHGCVLVVDADGTLAGIFTERDVLRKVVGKVALSTPVSEVMTAEPEAVSFHDTIAVALNKMAIGGFRHVPLVNIQMKPVGIVSVRDVVGYFVRCFPSHVLNVSPTPATRHPDSISTAG